MLDENIEKTFQEALEVLNHKSIQKLESNLVSLYQRLKELTASRDLWKRKYMELKGEKK